MNLIGKSAPLGATPMDGGANFSVFSRSASALELLFFDREEDPRPERTILLNGAYNRTYHYWHAFVPGVRAGQLYAYRALGSPDPEKILLDP